MGSFFFDPSKGETPEELRKRRAQAEAVLNGGFSPANNIGEGLAQLGAALGARIRASSADSAIKAGMAGADARMSPIMAAFFGGGSPSPTPTLSSAPASVSPASKPAIPIKAPGGVAEGIKATADALGIDPIALGTAISYETAGTFNPTKAGPHTQWGQHRGLIQFGEPQAAKYGVDWKNPIGTQLGSNGAVAKYLRDAGVKPGMGLLDIYSAINAGGVGRYNRSDAGNGGAPGTVADKVNNQMSSHRKKAMALLAGLPQTTDLVQRGSAAGMAAEPVPMAPSNLSASDLQQPLSNGPRPASDAVLKALVSTSPPLAAAAGPALIAQSFLGPKPQAQPAPQPMPEPQVMPVAAAPEPQIPLAPQMNPRNPQGLTTRQIRQMMDKGNGMDPSRIPFLRDAVNAPQQGAPMQQAMIQPQAPQTPLDGILNRFQTEFGPQGGNPAIQQASMQVPAPAQAQPAAAPQAQPMQNGIDPMALMKLAKDPWVMQNPVYANMINGMIEQRMKAMDPTAQMQIRKMQLELQNLEHPQMSPGDAAQLDFDKQKFAAEQGKPQVQTVGDALVDLKTGKPIYQAPAKPREPFKLQPGELYFDPTGKLIAAGGAKADELTAEQKNYNFAMEQLRKRGVPEEKLPSFQEYSKPKSRGIVFTSPDGTEVKIGGSDDGGLDGTSLPGEVGGRIGLGAAFLKNDYPQIIDMIKAGDATGPIDYLSGAVGRGNSGVVQRRMATGIDALRRGLTGAGMSASESGEYARRYEPQALDDAETLTKKAEGLKADLEAVANGTILGKAGKVSGMLPKQAVPKTSAPKVINGYTIEEVQ